MFFLVMAAHSRIEHDHSRPLRSQKPLDFRDGDARLPSNGNGADFADLLTHRRTVNGCKPRRLATSPERRSRVFSVLITRIVCHKYVALSTVVHPENKAFWCTRKAPKISHFLLY